MKQYLLSAFYLALIVFSAGLLAQEADGADPVAPLFVPAKLTDESRRWQAPYPGGAAGSNRSGVVELFYNVNTTGEPTEIVVGAYSHKVFIKNAIKTLKKWHFTPATKDGKPVDSAGQQIFLFSGRFKNQKVVDRFNEHYDRFNQEYAKPESRQALLEEHLDKMRRARQANPSNQAILHYARLVYAEKYLPKNEQISAAYLTDIYQLNGLNINKKLEVKRKLVNWLVEAGRYGDALDLIEKTTLSNLRPRFIAGKDASIESMFTAASSLQEFRAMIPELRKLLDPENGTFARTREEIEALQRTDQVFTNDFEVSERGYVLRRLLRNRFAIDQVNGQIDDLVFRCESKFHRLAFVIDQDYQLPRSWGQCMLQVNGVAGTQARLIEG